MKEKQIKKELKKAKKRKNVMSEEKIKQIDEMMADPSKLTINGIPGVQKIKEGLVKMTKKEKNQKEFEKTNDLVAEIDKMMRDAETGAGEVCNCEECTGIQDNSKLVALYDPLYPYITHFYKKFIDSIPFTLGTAFNEIVFRNPLTGESRNDSERKRLQNILSGFKKLLRVYDLRYSHILEGKIKAIYEDLNTDEKTILPFVGAVVASAIFNHQFYKVATNYDDFMGIRSTGGHVCCMHIDDPDRFFSDEHVVNCLTISYEAVHFTLDLMKRFPDPTFSELPFEARKLMREIVYR